MKSGPGGFQDSTVIGGLDRFLQRWAHELLPGVVGDAPYSKLTLPQRQEWAEAVLARLPAASAAERGAAVSRGVARPAVPGTKKRPAKLSSDDDVSRLKNVSARNLQKLKRLGLERVGDLLYLLPNRHNDFASMRKVSALKPGQDQTLVATVWEASLTGRGPRRKSTQAILGDDTGNIRAIWFNQPWLARTLKPGAQVVLSGKVNVFRGQAVFESPEYEILQDQDELVHTGRLVPVYPSTEGLPQRTLRRMVREALDACLHRVVEFVPDDVRHRAGLAGLQNAISQAHYPDSQQDWSYARRRLAFDELFLMQLSVIRRKRDWQEGGSGVPVDVDREKIGRFLKSLPFSLTVAQDRVLNEVLGDIEQHRPMSRLVQGDVGSGKTVVALAGLLAAVFGGYQAALMAPTEILSEQHFMTVSRLLSGLAEFQQQDHLTSIVVEPGSRPVVVALLLGSLPKRAKDEVHRGIAEGEIDIVIGTQALIQEAVEMPRLALVVVDEQHRFGVMQRASLRQKGRWPHLLAMSATPIPRSLALTIYGDLDMSTIDELPPGRQRIRTRWVEPDRRQAAYGFVRKEVEVGRQAFIVCPLIETSEAIQTKAATEEHERLSTQVFPDLRLGLLHGRMALREKEMVMGEFQEGRLDILVSTPVIEVGIDIPNATVMLIDGAERFGLAQLHQFRGRVGRGAHPSYCLLLADSPGQDARERLKIVEHLSDGFQLAEEDLRLRGPGDYLGTRQSGLPTLRVARITDQDILLLARREAAKVLDSDPEFSREEHAPLAEHFARYAAALTEEMS